MPMLRDPGDAKSLADLQAEAFFGVVFWGIIVVLVLFAFYEWLVQPLIDLDVDQKTRRRRQKERSRP